MFGLSRFFKLSVLLEDVLMGGALGGDVRVMVSAQDVGSALEHVMANPPASLGVAVDLTHAGVHPDANCGDERRFAQIRTEA